MVELLRNRARHRDIDRFGQSRKFLQRILDAPIVTTSLDSNEERVFSRLLGV
jgi:hypothetical protein